MAVPASSGLVLAARAAGQGTPQQQPGAQEPAWRFTGAVKDPYGMGVKGARVRVVQLNLATETATDGSFQFEGRGTPGVVQVSAERPGYLPRTVSVTIEPGGLVRRDIELAINGEHFRQALDDVKLRLYREGGYSPLVWFIPRLGLVVRYTRPELRTSQDRLFDMLSAVVIAKDVMAPFPYLHDTAQLVGETVTPSEHLLRRYPRGPLLERVGQGSLDLQSALAWTERYFEFYRNGKGQNREVPGWQAIQQALDAVTAELFVEPGAGGVYVPGYGLVFNALPAPQFPPITALSVLGMLLAARVPVPDGERIFVQMDDRQALWALEAPVQTLRKLVSAQSQETFQLDLATIQDLYLLRNGMPWGL